MESDISPPRSSKRIFVAARRLTDPEERKTYLQQVCGDDTELRAKVDGLLAALDDAACNPLDVAVQKLGPAETAGPDAANGKVFDISSHPVIGPYKLLERLGEGGMGTVFMAQQTEPVKRRVALKVIKPGMDSREVIARFEAERQALAMMDHSNIAKIFDGGLTEEGRPYFAMELVRGLPIDEYCDQVEMSLRDRLKLFIDVCRAVQHAHLKGIIHRDLKPTNILVTLHDGVPVVKVIDFGIAKALDQELTERTLFTRFTALVGTPVYMSPEQAELSGLDIDTRSDVYSLGVLLYKLLVGVTPFDERSLKRAGVDEMRRVICEDEPLRPSRRVSTLDNELVSTVSGRRGVAPRQLSLSMRRELDWIVMKALEKDRARRYQAAADLAADVQRHLDHVPVVACPPTVRYRFQKAYHRNRATVNVVAFVVCILLATSAISLWQTREARRAWHASQVREQRATDLLEATQYQVAIAAFREADLSRLAETTAALTTTQRSAAKSDPSSGSLATLLRRSAQPRPQQSFPHPASVLDVSVSPDGNRMVTVDAEGLVRLWDLSRSSAAPGSRASGSPAMGATILGTHREPAHAVAISPDGTRAASGSTKGHFRIWDLEQGTVVTRLQPVRTGIETIVWAPDGQHIAVGARYSETWVCDAEGGEKFRIKNDARHESLLFSPDSRRLLVSTRANVDVWDLETRTRRSSYAIDPLANARAMCWAGADEEWLVAGEMYAEALVILDRDTGKRLGDVRTGAGYAQHLAASPDGQWLAATYANGQIQLYQLSRTGTGKVIGRLETQFSFDEVTTATTPEPRWTVRWLHDSRRLVTAGSNGRVQVWGVDEIRPARVLATPADATPSYAFPLGTDELVYYVRSGEVADRPQRCDYYGNPTSPPGQSTSSVDVSNPSDDHLVATHNPGRIAIVSLETGRTVGEFTKPPAAVLLAISADATVVAATSFDNEVFVWRTRDQWSTAELVGTWKTPYHQRPLIVDEGNTLILEDLEKSEVAEWDLETRSVLRRYHMSRVSADFCVSHRGDRLAIAATDRIKIWNRRTGALQMEMANLSKVKSLAFFPDDRVLVSGHEDQSIRAWHIPTGQPLGVLFAPSESLRGRAIRLLPIQEGHGLVALYDQAGLPERDVVVLGILPTR